MTGKVNRTYKNSLFIDLFYEDESAEENEIALYNALHEEPLPEGTEIRKFRVENVLYMNFKNDISFDAGGKLIVFGEHQSTINENMPLRSLMYVGRAYEQMVPVADRYRKKRVALPMPEFCTFYNGAEEWEKETELSLSDAYKVKSINPMLELRVKVVNINLNKGHVILERCPVLHEYSQLVETVRRHQATGEEDAFQNAVDECIRKGILSGYLQRKGSEAVNMLIAEYDYDMDIAVQRKEAFEEGEERINKLNQKLLQDGRISDLERATEDSKFQKKLLKEYGLQK